MVCLTDRDPERKIGNGKFHKCYPFEYGIPSDNVEYKNHSQEPIDKYIAYEHIKFLAKKMVKERHLNMIWLYTIQNVNYY